MSEESETTGTDRRELLRRGAAAGAAGVAVWAAPATLTTSAASAATAPPGNCVTANVTCEGEELRFSLDNNCGVAVVDGSLGLVLQPGPTGTAVVPSSAIFSFTFFEADPQGQPVGPPLSSLTIFCPPPPP